MATRQNDVLLLGALAEGAVEPAPTAEASELLVAELVARARDRTEPLERARTRVEECFRSLRDDPATAARALRLLAAALDEASARRRGGSTGEQTTKEGV